MVVEHDMTVIAQADHVVDLGPGGGAQGGRIVAQGSPEQVAADPGSRTALYLSERMTARPGKSSAIAGGGPIVG
ncbi:hypothetical protein ACIA5E_01810 [Nocardia asteroides]|uniref:hypothetical protein n=1 Tax=Nocardia asteroides TaxID=1824 RepID=UPI0037A560DC